MGFLKEDLEDERSLQNLVSAVLMKMGDSIFKELQMMQGHIDLGVYASVHLESLLESKYLNKEKKGLHVLNENIIEFMRHGNVAVELVRQSKGKKTLGTYYSDKDGYRIERAKKIHIFVQPEEFQERVGDDYKTGNIKDGRGVYMKLYFMYSSSLIHELRHAYDDFRTKGKAFDNKQSKQFYDNQRLGKHEILTNAEEVADNTMRDALVVIAKQYVRLPHEVWARFSQAIAEIDFVKMEFDDALTFPETMYPLKDVILKFKMKMEYFSVLDEKMKRRLYRAVSNAWHDAKDYLEKYGTYYNPHNKKLHEMDTQTKTQELEGEIEMRLRPDENFLPYHDIISISDIFGMDEEDVAQAVSDFVLKREKQKYQEAKEDIVEYVAHLQQQGVRTDTQSDEALTKAFLEANGNYYVTEMGLNFDVLKNIMKMATKDPDQPALFEALRRQIQKTILRSLTGMA